jgi:hypothetical protein
MQTFVWEPGRTADPSTALGMTKVTSERDIEQVFVGGELKVDHGEMVQQDLPGIQNEVYRRVTTPTR